MGRAAGAPSASGAALAGAADGRFPGGLLVVVLATESGVGTYDDTLFWDHMIQHLMLIMIARRCSSPASR